jgi:hypothetical protein
MQPKDRLDLAGLRRRFLVALIGAAVLVVAAVALLEALL